MLCVDFLFEDFIEVIIWLNSQLSSALVYKRISLFEIRCNLFEKWRVEGMQPYSSGLTLKS